MEHKIQFTNEYQMKIILQPYNERGTYFKKIKALENTASIDVHNALLLTGANGSGKSVLIDSVAVAAGLGNRYSSSKTSYTCTNLDMAEAREKCGGATLYSDQDKQLEFDLVLRYRADETRMMPIAMDTMEDMEQLFSARGSHGQVNLTKLGAMLKKAEDFLDDKEKRKLLLLIDEPETGAGPDFLLHIMNRLFGITLRTMRSKRFKLVVATQSPFIYGALDQAGAFRLDLGGWRDDVDPFPALLPLARQAYLTSRKAIEERDTK